MAGTIFNGTYANGYVLTNTAQNPATIGSSGMILAGSTGGGLTAQSIGVAWSVSNLGTVVGKDGNFGVYLQGGGMLSNAGSGLVSSSGSIGVGSGGVGIEGGLGTVVNAGSIYGRTVLYAGGSLTNTTSGVVGSVDIEAVSGTIVNSGSMARAGLGAGGSITNLAGGIQSGVAVSGGVGVVVNGGTIAFAASYQHDSAVALGDGGSATNQSGGTISSGSDGVAVRGAAGSIVNAGTITASQTYANAGSANAARGIYLGQGGAVTNAASAVIAASGLFETGHAEYGDQLLDGIDLEASGSVANDGTITSSGGWSNGSRLYKLGDGVYASNTAVSAVSITNMQGATIAAEISAIDAGGAATIGNAGTLIGTVVYGVTLRGGGSISNAGSGFISGGFDGIRAIDAYVSVHNTGSIDGVQNYAARLNSGYLYNGFSGRLTGGSEGVRFENAGGKLVNSGMISTPGTYNPGLGSGVYMRGTGTIINSGTGTISGRLDGVFMQSTHEDVVNNAVMVGTTRYGIRLSNGGSVVNSGEAVGGKVGIDVAGGFYGTLAGTISVSSGAVVQGTGTASYGIRVGGGIVYNAGIVAGGSIGLNVATAEATTVSNLDEVTGTAGYGIRIGGGATVLNSGYVFGGKIGVDIVGGTTASTFTNTGTLSGAIGLSVTDGATADNTTLIDGGAIIGSGGTAAVFGAGDDLLSLRPGASFGGGTVDGGGGANTLELGAGAGTLAGLGTTVLNFGSIVFDGGAAWDLVGNPVGFGGVISGFAVGDTIDLAGLHETISNYTSGTLTLAGDATIALQIPGAFTKNSFLANPDDSNGTAITIACFAAGTRIATPAGEQPIETLRPGDAVRSAFGGSVEVVWIGRRRLDCRRHPDPTRVWPVRVAAGAFAAGRPARDLWLSPDHCVLVDDVLVPVRTLVNGRSIVQEQWREVTYHHLECPLHDAILAEGLPAETYLDTGNRSDFEGGGPALVLHPDFARDAWLAGACADQITHGPVHARVRARLARRLARLAKRNFPSSASAPLEMEKLMTK